ncbi:hypothetical protein G6F70_003551 [Rhizopus microsporus]|uniref:Uncharacterized protein n=1 Tax=Rhizopus azygosporus TaxID=86630 RepID=A0A367JXA6_RHIAZ|nr:hypothetical protein G6F71_003565 [Rhizopus microsporus]RCH94632.1 hypothetical protein CU097_010991 [Rhizopus azygosporus]KAG1201012.1 hypothetical protein G6F70_003551 [Rhizopus microsporus]KAG1212955.1 hypothetical protein G6F69_003257 [Rhizopus microsporus]KAG1234890.1 hypothetical protein G6F67_003196 [Rhizopus microsporus]
MDTTTLPQELMLQSSANTPPRVMNRKVKESIDENTNMMNKKNDDSEEDSEEDTYSFENEQPPLLLDPKSSQSDSVYHAYSDNTCYHPTSFEGIKEEPSGRFRTISLDDTDSLSVQEAVYTASVFSNRIPMRSRRSSSQADSILHALAPPSHALKARRLSKNNDPEPDQEEMRRKRSIVHEYQKELNSHSAVSPRFMTLRKLSEVTVLPSHGISFANSADIPPVPHIPHIHANNNSNNNNTMTTSVTHPSPPPSISEPSDSSKPTSPDVLSGIDRIIEAQLQYHLGQMAWRVSESHIEARRFWEEQKSQVFGFTTNVIDRLERDLNQRLKDLIDSKTDLDPDVSSLKRELEWHKQQLAEKQCQLHELEVLRIRNSELEKQHDIDVAIIKSQQIDKEKIEARLLKYEETGAPGKKHQMKLFELKSYSKQLRSHVARVEQINKTLHQQVNEYQKQLEAKDEEIKQLLTKMKRKCSNDSTNMTARSSKHQTWVEIMESEDEAKKNAEMWANKYKELEKVHQELEIDHARLISEKDQEIRQLKQLDSMNRVQLEYMQLELKKKVQPSKHCACNKYQIQAPSRVSKSQSVIAKDGYLTFTAEINGQLSKYSVKIPPKQAQIPIKKTALNPNAPPWRGTFKT